MRAMRARCLLALDLAARDAGEGERARDVLGQAQALLRDMEMSFWLAIADAALATLA
jgi:hypothetical protein